MGCVLANPNFKCGMRAELPGKHALKDAQAALPTIAFVRREAYVLDSAQLVGCASHAS